VQVDLTEKSQENVDQMITEMKEKLQFVNQDVIRAGSYSVKQYDELREIYEWVMSKPSMSVSEMQAVLSELGSLRDK
jgi:uncharacterized protein YfkK (UPF0435 family)